MITLAFAGDVHFQLQLAALLDHPGAGLGALDRLLSDADVTVVNLESAITERGALEAKEREDLADRYWYRTPPAALPLLAAAGLDVVTSRPAGDPRSRVVPDSAAPRRCL